MRLMRLTAHAKQAITLNQTMKMLNERLVRYHEHNLVGALEFDHDYGWRLKLHQHLLVNCRLPYENYSQLETENWLVGNRPSILPIIEALSFLDSLKKPITPDETAEQLADYFADCSEAETADNLRFQIPYLRNARYTHHLLLINDLKEVQCETKEFIY